MYTLMNAIKNKLTEDNLYEYLCKCGYDREIGLLEDVLESTDQEPFNVEDLSEKLSAEIFRSMIPVMEELKMTYKKTC